MVLHTYNLYHTVRWLLQSMRCTCQSGCSNRVIVNCRPAKVKEGKPHPHPIVETASLSSVIPPDPVYQHHIKVIHSACNSFILQYAGPDLFSSPRIL